MILQAIRFIRRVFKIRLLRCRSDDPRIRKTFPCDVPTMLFTLTSCNTTACSFPCHLLLLLLFLGQGSHLFILLFQFIFSPFSRSHFSNFSCSASNLIDLADEVDFSFASLRDSWSIMNILLVLSFAITSNRNKVIAGSVSDVKGQ